MPTAATSPAAAAAAAVAATVSSATSSTTTTSSSTSTNSNQTASPATTLAANSEPTTTPKKFLTVPVSVLSKLVLGDVVSGFVTAAAMIVAIIDRSVIANMSGKMTLLAGLKEGFSILATRPWLIMRQPSVLAVFGVYSTTYAIANSTETICLNSVSPTSQTTHNDPALPKFITSSIVNIGMTLWKDQLLTRWFGQGPVRPLPFSSYSLFATRDALTMAASFTLPPIISAQIQAAFKDNSTGDGSDNVERQRRIKRVADTVSQLVLPCAIQIVSTPLHLLGLDMYNRPSSSASSTSATTLHTTTNTGKASAITWGTRWEAVKKEYAASTFARMGRILPAFGIGGVLNRECRASMRTALGV